MRIVVLLSILLTCLNCKAETLEPGQERELSAKETAELKLKYFIHEKPILITGKKYLYDDFYIGFEAIFAPIRSSLDICKSKLVSSLILERKLYDIEFLKIAPKDEAELVYLSSEGLECELEKIKDGIILLTPITEHSLYKIIHHQQELLDLAINIAEKEEQLPIDIVNKQRNYPRLYSVSIESEHDTNNYVYSVNFKGGFSFKFSIINDKFQIKDVGFSIH